ncbi:MAG: histidine kinase [Thermoproteus sp. JCHS_4]|jgi:Predicted signal-transduction protein containing cAMP-binding and CBS domains|nr:MAG: histidine kinase [Thermoproteus sp. JCHS_4]
MSAAQFASTDVVKATPDISIKEAAKILKEHNIGLLVLVDKEDQSRAVGVVSERDLVRAVAEGVDPSRPVWDIATRSVISVEADDPLSKAAELMRRHNIRHVVVVKDGRLYGVLSIKDLVYEDNALKVIAGYDEWTFERGMSA